MRQLVMIEHVVGPCSDQRNLDRLDERVATEVMGWHRLEGPVGLPLWCSGIPDTDTRVVQAFADGPNKWSPTSSVLDARRVIDRMLDLDTVVSVTFLKDSLPRTEECHEHDHRHVYVWVNPERGDVESAHKIRMRGPTMGITVSAIAVWLLEQPDFNEWREGLDGESVGE